MLSSGRSSYLLHEPFCYIVSLIFNYLKDIDISFQFLCLNITDEVKITKTLRVL